jgi:hypothetical protein
MNKASLPIGSLKYSRGCPSDAFRAALIPQRGVDLLQTASNRSLAPDQFPTLTP